ncbi:MAG: DUF3237 domain-containing protein [Pseudomonadota bacterium]
MQLVHEFTFTGLLAEGLPIGTGPIGTRNYLEVTGGEVTGDRVRGKVLGGGEWALFGPDGFVRVDVRLQMQTHDDAYLYVQYGGLLGMTGDVQASLQTGSDFGDQYFYTNPRIETGDERYQWLNTTFFVGEGRFLAGGGVEYRVWRPA